MPLSVQDILHVFVQLVIRVSKCLSAWKRVYAREREMCWSKGIKKEIRVISKLKKNTKKFLLEQIWKYESDMSLFECSVSNCCKCEAQYSSCEIMSFQNPNGDRYNLLLLKVSFHAGISHQFGLSLWFFKILLSWLYLVINSVHGWNHF